METLRARSSTPKTALAALLTFGLLAAGPAALAEEAPAPSEPAPAEPAPSEPAPGEPAPAESAYVPPPEANEGVGGWAVVDPNTGNVHGVVVCTADVCGPDGSWGGVMPVEYMGCAAGCVLRFQTRATADGNVAGWHGTQTHVDANGRATQTNDGSVKWVPESKTFQIRGQVQGGTRTQTLVPERTASDPERSNLHTGIVDIETRATQESAGQVADIRTYQRDLSETSSEVTIAFPLWSPEPRIFSYLLQHGWSQDADPGSALDQIGKDVDSALVDDGYTTAEIAEDPETGEQVESEVIDQGSGFVQSIREATARAVRFLAEIFGGGRLLSGDR